MAILAFQKPDKVVMLEALVTPCVAFFFHRSKAMLSTPFVLAVLSMSSHQYLVLRKT